MAEDTITEVEQETTSSNLVFSDDEIADLETEFNPDESTEDDGQETEGEEDGQSDEDEDLEDLEDEDDEDDEEEEDPDSTLQGDEEKPGADSEAEEDEEEGFTLVVDGQEVEVPDVDALAALAQKGIFYERRAGDTKRALDNANFTMKAMINDHFGFLEEFYAQKFGDYESARQHVAKLAHSYVVPYYKELQAEPEQQQLLRDKRQLEREKRNGGQQQTQSQNTFTQDEISELQTLEHNVSTALGEVGLPEDSEPLRKRMADIMLGALERDEYMHPLSAAKHLLRERQQLQKELARTAPKGRKGKKSKKQQKADIAAAKTRRSSKKRGTGDRGGQRRRAEPQFMTGREFLNGINSALDLEP